MWGFELEGSGVQGLGFCVGFAVKGSGASGLEPLSRVRVRSLQLNVGSCILKDSTS